KVNGAGVARRGVAVEIVGPDGEGAGNARRGRGGEAGQRQPRRGTGLDIDVELNRAHAGRAGIGDGDRLVADRLEGSDEVMTGGVGGGEGVVRGQGRLGVAAGAV